MPREGVYVALEWIMDKTPVPVKNAGHFGPNVGLIKTNTANSTWINAYNNSEWRQVQSGYIIAIGLMVDKFTR